jgi:hypothetical protein
MATATAIIRTTAITGDTPFFFISLLRNFIRSYLLSFCTIFSRFLIKVSL